MLFNLIILTTAILVAATPPACFLDCVNGISHICDNKQGDIKCICKVHEAVVQCISHYCPTDHFYSSRDHFIGTCMEHGHGFEFTIVEESAPVSLSNEVGLGPEEFEDSEFVSSDEAETEYATEFSQDPEDIEVSDWSDNNGWLEEGEWPGEDDLKPSELSHDVIKNYMSYFLKDNSAPHPHPPLRRAATATGTGFRDDTKRTDERPMIVHGPGSYVPTAQKAPSQQFQKSKFHKNDGIFDRDKQGQILRRRRS